MDNASNQTVNSYTSIKNLFSGIACDKPQKKHFKRNPPGHLKVTRAGQETHARMNKKSIQNVEIFFQKDDIYIYMNKKSIQNVEIFFQKDCIMPSIKLQFAHKML